MSRCTFCRKKTSIVLPCKACDCRFCTQCIQLEKHDCKKMDKAKENDRGALEEKLMSAKMSQRQNIKI